MKILGISEDEDYYNSIKKYYRAERFTSSKITYKVAQYVMGEIFIAAILEVKRYYANSMEIKFSNCNHYSNIILKNVVD